MIASWMQAFDNPVFLKEMRVGFREKKVFYALMAWVVIVALVASVTALGAFDSNQGIDNLPEAGMMFMEVLFWVQMALLAMLAPSLTTSAVSGERERKCFDMLLTTHLSPSELIYGKFGFAASFIMLALCSTIPLESIVFFLGGVSLTSFVFTKLILLSFGLLCSLYGLMMSARESRSAYATGQTYLGLIFICWFGMFGVIGLRYADDVPTVVYVGVAISILYLGLFLFWKSVNHLEERARHLKILLAIGLGFYLVALGIVALSQYIYPDFEDGIWAASGPIHYLLFGLLLNPMRPSRRIEQERFQTNLLSRPLFWTVLFTLGLLLPLLACDDDKVLAICFYAEMAGFATAWFARGLSLGKEARYPQILGACWLLFNVVPAFTAIEAFGKNAHNWHPATVSPLTMLVAYADQDPNQLPVIGIIFYTILLFIGQFKHSQWSRKTKATQDSVA
jgi:ABC-type transport system involved in multi-copper enzyme maturation permease subunit